MLRIECVRGGPLCGVPVQCSEIGQDHGPLEKAEKTQARLAPHNTPLQRDGSPLLPSPGLTTSPLPNPPSAETPTPPMTLLFATG